VPDPLVVTAAPPPADRSPLDPVRPRRRSRLAPLVTLVVAILVATALAGCEYPPNTRYVDPVFADVDITTAIIYRRTTTYQGATIDLRLDIHQPRGDTATKRPVVMWMFGGGWVAGNRQSMSSWASDSARRGYVGVTIDYRIRSATGLDLQAAAFDAYDDAVAAVAWLKSNASTYRIDPTAIVAGGYSAGAINAMNLLYLPGRRGPATSPVAGGVSIAGLSFATPTAGDPPSIMHHGTTDTVVPLSAAQSTCNAANAAGSVCQLITYAGQGHNVVSTRATEIRASTAHFLMDEILLRKGYYVPPA
jgi:acetyl esterase/lipase